MLYNRIPVKFNQLDKATYRIISNLILKAELSIYIALPNTYCYVYKFMCNYYEEITRKSKCFINHFILSAGNIFNQMQAIRDKYLVMLVGNTIWYRRTWSVFERPSYSVWYRPGIPNPQAMDQYWPMAC